MALNIVSPLPDEVEAIVTQVIGCAIEVHKRLGPGLNEGQYEDALMIELEVQGLRFEAQRKVVITYRDKPLRPYRIDLIVEGQVIVEIKAVEYLHPVHRSQVISYLHATGLRIGLLMNFNSSILAGSIKRIVV